MKELLKLGKSSTHKYVYRKGTPGHYVYVYRNQETREYVEKPEEEVGEEQSHEIDSDGMIAWIEDFQSCVSNQELIDLSHYKGGMYRMITTSLRSGQMDEKTARIIKSLDTIFKTHASSVGKRSVYRGAAFDKLTADKFVVGETFTDRSFISFSAEKGVATQFASNNAEGGMEKVLFELKTDNRDRWLPGVLSELELIGQRDMILRVVGVKVENGIRVIQCVTV
jgi:hypothetical protein